MISTTIRNSPNAPPGREDTPPPRNRSKNSATRRPTISPKHTFETGRQTTPIRSSLKQKRVAEPCSLQRPFSTPHVDFFRVDGRKDDEFAKFEILPIFVTATRKKRSFKPGCRWQSWWKKIFEPPFFWEVIAWKSTTRSSLSPQRTEQESQQPSNLL